MSGYVVKDIRESWRWLGHEGFTELAALHPEYRPGKENPEWNVKNNTFPRTWYTKSEEEVLRFVAKCHGTHMVCYSENERPRIFKNSKGYARSAKEGEIEVARNMFLDIDFLNKRTTKAQLDAIDSFLSATVSDYLSTLGLQKPELAFTGHGYHLQFAYPEIAVKEYPDIAKRQRKFAEDFAHDFHEELQNLEAKVDSTQDLRRMVKIYGTAKPNVGIFSRWHGNIRHEDEELRKYLLGMELEDSASWRRATEPAFGPKLITVYSEVPPLALTLARQDPKLRDLNEGNGKPAGSDTSASGIDFSIARRFIWLGYKDIDGIATYLALRPNGSFQKHHKSEDYLRRTIAKALMS